MGGVSVGIHRDFFGHNDRATTDLETFNLVRFNLDLDLFTVPRHVDLAHTWQGDYRISFKVLLCENPHVHFVASPFATFAPFHPSTFTVMRVWMFGGCCAAQKEAQQKKHNAEQQEMGVFGIHLAKVRMCPNNMSLGNACPKQTKKGALALCWVQCSQPGASVDKLHLE